MSENRWPTVNLGEYVDVTPGYAFDSSEFTVDEDNIPLVKGSNVQQGYIEWDESKYWPKDQVDEHDRFLLEEGDVVLAMDRPWVQAGLKWAWIRPGDTPALLVQRIARLRSKDGLNQAFLRYTIGSPQFENYIRPIVTGVNVPHISGKQIENYSFDLPPLEYQLKAASILTKYDNLIENNRQRIKIIEEAVERLYYEWFVLFNFPGNEHIEQSQSSMGSIPKKWEIKKFTDVGEVLSGGTPKTKIDEYWDGKIPFFTPRDSHGNHFVHDTEKRITKKGLENSSTSQYPPRTIFITARGTVGNLALPAESMAMNQSCYALRSKEYSQEFLFLLIQERIDYLQKNTGGATFDTIIIDTFRKMDVLAPPQDLVEEFTEIVKPMFDLLPVLGEKNRILRQIRDLLQPRLISGELDLSKLDIDID